MIEKKGSLHEPWVAYRLTGGVGNQLFQYAAAKSLALRSGAKLYFDERALKDVRNGKRYSLRGSLALEELKGLQFGEPLPDSLNFHFHKFGKNKITDALLRLSSRTIRRTGPRVVIEKNYQYKEIPIKLYQNTYLVGNWQSYRYFSDLSEPGAEVLAALKSLPTPKSLPGGVPVSSVIGIHVRRTDFVSSSKHLTLTEDYYHRALAAASPDLPKLIFSDDSEWCKTNLDLGRSVFFASDLGLSDMQEMALMSQCESLIIANSTFSWWAGYLSSLNGGMVIAPEKWYLDGRNEGDLVPKGWGRVGQVDYKTEAIAPGTLNGELR